MDTNDATQAAEGTEPSTEGAAEGTSETPAFDWGEDDGGELAAREAEKPAEPAAEPAKPATEPEKPSQLTPAQAALAKKEAAFRAEQKAHAAAVEQLKKDRADLETSKGSADALRKAASTDLASFVAGLGLSPEALKEQVVAAWWSIQPEDKRPPEFKARAAGRTEIDEIKAAAAKAAKDLEDYKAEVARKEQEREASAAAEQFFSTTRAEFAKLDLPIANALGKHDPSALDDAVIEAFKALEEEGVDVSTVTPDKVGPAVEAALSKRYAFLRDVFAPKTETTQGPKDKKAPTSALSTKKVAGGGSTKPTAQSEEERWKASLAALEA